jgi:hypothetical protein
VRRGGTRPRLPMVHVCPVTSPAVGRPFMSHGK